MTTPANAVDELAQAVDQLGVLVEGVREDQWSQPTPCAEWDVRELVRHVIAGQLGFAAAVDPDAAAGVDPHSDDDAQLPAAVRATGAVMVAAFRRPGVLGRLMDVPVGRVPGAVAVNLRMTESFVHGWDLARATGQRVAFDDAVVEEMVGFTRGALALIPAERTPFAPEQPAPAEASPVERLAALLGRAVD